MSTRRACIAHLQPRLRKVLCLTCTAVQVNGNPCFSPPKHLRSYFNPPSFGHVVSFILHFTMPTGLNLLTTDVATWFSDGPTVLSPSWEHEALAYIQKQILQGCLAATLSCLLFRCRYVPGFHLLHFTADHLGACCNWEQIKAVHLWSTAAQKQKCDHLTQRRRPSSVLSLPVRCLAPSHSLYSTESFWGLWLWIWPCLLFQGFSKASTGSS